MLLSIDRVLCAASAHWDEKQDGARGASSLRKLMDAAGQPVPDFHVINQWVERDMIPGKWTGAVLYALALKGVHPMNLLIQVHPMTVDPRMVRWDQDDDSDLLAQADRDLADLINELNISEDDTFETSGSAT